MRTVQEMRMYPCRTCGAQPGEPCRTLTTGNYTNPHQARWEPEFGGDSGGDPATFLASIWRQAGNGNRIAPIAIIRLAAAVEGALGLASSWQSLGDGEDAQSECAAELREVIAHALTREK